MKVGKSGLSRRGFLKRATTCALGAAGLPYIVPASALGAGGRLRPSERITLGFIGVGKQGRDAHVRGLVRNPQAHILAVCDVESERLEQSRRIVEDYYANASGQGTYTGCATYRDFRELLARDDIDAVVVSTPDHWHAVPCIEAARAGKDVYCEKPLTHEIAEGRAIADTVRRYSRVFQTGSQQRSEYNGMFRRAAELVRNGVLGDLESIDINVGGPPTMDFHLAPEPAPDTLDWDRWVGPAPWRPYSSTLCPMNYDGYPHWRYHRDFGGGGYNDFGAHHFDIAQWALDMDASGPVEIHPPDGKEYTRLTYRYANGVRMYHGGETDCVFNGSNGRILVNRTWIRSEPASILDTRLGPDDVYLDHGLPHHDDWLECIRTRRQPIANAETGHRTATVCHLGLIAYRLNRPLQWDPDAERFVNDAEANRLLARPYRSPWHL